jgi:hypothetical protein
MSATSRICLRGLPVAQKLLLSLFLVTIGAGYGVALLNLYLTYHLTDGEPGLSVADLRRAFYGNRENTKLASKIDGGSMAQFLPRAGDKEKILSWIQDGASEDGYRRVIRPILQQNCVRCHNPAGLQRFAPLTSYEEVMAVAQIDRGEPPQLWARVAHTHIQSIGLLFFALAGVFSFTQVREKLKVAVIVLPFLVLLADFGLRFLIKYEPRLVWLMAASGALMGLLFAVLILVPLHEMWLRKE